MPTFVTFTDSHIRVKTPLGRVEDDWLSVCLSQFEQVLALAKEKEASAVLCSGDLGDSPKWHDKVRGDVATVELISLIKQYNIPIYLTLGQHDVYGHNMDTWMYTAVGVLAEAGVVKVLRRGESVLIDNTMIYGFAFGEEETESLLAGQWRAPQSHNPYFKIGLVHASVGAEETMGWAGIQNQKVIGLDVAQFGDIHEGFDCYEMPTGGCICYSPGSLTRASRADRGRTPMCAVIDVEGKGFDLNFYDISDGIDEDVFHDEIGETLTVEEQIDTAAAFKHLVGIARTAQDETPTQKIARVGREGEFSQRQIALVQERLDEE